MRLNVQCAGAALLCALPCALLSAVLGTLRLPAVAADDAITPYRPSVSNSAQLPLPGQLELELGGLHAKSGDARRDTLPTHPAAPMSNLQRGR